MTDHLHTHPDHHDNTHSAAVATDSSRAEVLTVDEEHRLLLALAQGINAERANELMKNLEDYVRGHFQHEERLMQTWFYPLRHVHVMAHQKLAHRVALWQLREGGWTDAEVDQFRRFLTAWLELHIQEHDLPLAAWLNERVSTSPVRYASPAR
jgi:hemerythrin-like metal-binding protein